jgi:hypothetical protein
MGSVGIAAWIAKLLFLGLMIAGIVTGQLRARAIVVFLVLGALRGSACLICHAAPIS